MRQNIRPAKPALVLGGIFLVLLSGCSPWAPIPQRTTPFQAQPVIESANHWKVLAENIAQKAKEAQPDDETGVKGGSDPLFIRSEGPKGPCAPSGCPSNFQKAFQELLTTALVQEGMSVTENAGSNNILKYNVQIIDHNWKGPSTLSPLTDLESSDEVIVTASLQKGDQYLMRISRVFYVRGTEKPQFSHKGSGSSGLNPLPTQTYQVVSQ